MTYTQAATPSSGVTGAKGTRKPRGASGLRRRRISTARLTRAKAKRVPMLVASARAPSGMSAARTVTKAVTMTVPARGTPVRGWTLENSGGMSPSRDIAKRMRICPYCTVSTTLVVAMTAPMDSSTGHRLPPPTERTSTWLSVASVPANRCQGIAPTAASATAQYRAVTRASERMMARGRSRCGFFASSPAVDAASKPMYEKNSEAAPAVIPAVPSGNSGRKFPAWKAVKATAQNITSTTTFTVTMTALATALSRAPRSSTTIARITITAAGTLSTPPSPGGAASGSGSVQPIVSWSSSLTYWPQPTATAATDTPYSRIRHQPQTQATSSPRVA